MKRNPGRIGPAAADEHVADIIDFRREAARIRPRHDQAMRFDVLVRKRQPMHAATGRRADRRKLHVSLPQPLGIDLRIVSRLSHASLPSLPTT